MATRVEQGCSPADGQNTASSLRDQLQDLWKLYLMHLDKYTTAQRYLDEIRSRGTFSLAEARHKNMNRLRYGPDYFDDRAQAATRYAADVQDGQHILVVSSSLTDDRAVQSGTAGSTDEKATVARAADPLRWFGLLTPPQLKACQSSFLEMVTSPVIDAGNAARAMRQTEVEIRRLRKDIRRAEKRLP